MSVQATSWVLRHSPTKGSDRLVLLALADHAAPDGTNAYPAVRTLAQLAGLKDRATQYALRRLEAGGHIRPEGWSHRNTVNYRVVMVAAVAPEPTPKVRAHADAPPHRSAPEGDWPSRRRDQATRWAYRTGEVGGC